MSAIGGDENCSNPMTAYWLKALLGVFLLGAVELLRGRLIADEHFWYHTNRYLPAGNASISTGDLTSLRLTL
jgi:hypothetical protein